MIERYISHFDELFLEAIVDPIKYSEPIKKKFDTIWMFCEDYGELEKLIPLLWYYKLEGWVMKIKEIVVNIQTEQIWIK